MCAFEINFYSQKQEFHRYSTDDFALLDIGIGNYNISSLGNFFNINLETGAELKPLNPDIKEFFSGTSSANLVESFVGANVEDKMEIMAYDENEKKYKLKKGLSQIVQINTAKYKEHTQPSEDIKIFLSDWHNIQVGIQNDPKVINGYKLIAHRIQNSISGCITFKLNGVNILNQPRQSLIRLYILENKDASSSRTVAFNGSPFIAAIPQTAEGLRYSHGNTASSPIGAYETMSGEDINPHDQVAGQLRTVWDPVTRTWESGTQQIMARLIDDIPAATIPELTKEQLLALSRDEVYDVPPEENPIAATFYHGRAIPLSTENGNPYLFGPNFLGGCSASSKKSIVEVVNRSPRSYKQGTLVICSYMNGSWIIISGEGEKEESKKLLNVGRFEFQQYIIPLNLYFAKPGSNEKFLPDKWASKWRSAYYVQSSNLSIIDRSTFALNISASNMPTDTADPISYLINADFNATQNQQFYNNSKWITDSFGGALKDYFNYYHKEDDIYQSVYQGFIDDTGEYEYEYPFPKNAIVNSNSLETLNLPNVNNNGTGDPIDKFAIPLFWGMLFPDGYKPQQAQFFFDHPSIGAELKSSEIYYKDFTLKELSAQACLSFPTFTEDKQLLRYIKNTLFISDNLKFNNTNNLPFSRPQDFVKQAGGVYRNFRSGGIYLYDLNALNKKLAMEDMDDGFGSMLDYSYDELVNNTGIKHQIFGLEPLNPRRLQFSPMSIDFLYSQSTLDNLAFSILKTNVNFLNNLPPAASIKDKSLASYATHLWNLGSPVLYYPINDTIFNGNSYKFKGLAFNEAFGPNPINSNTLARHPEPLGVTEGGLVIPIADNAGSIPRTPVIPILTCKSNIKTNSKTLIFKTFGYFGNPQKVTVTPGVAGIPTIIPIGGGLAWQTPNSPVSSNQSPQWGDRNRTDDIDSLGTMALHVRIFEAWPEHLTIYLGPIYTPLHFNPSGPDFDYDATVDNNGQIIITDKMTDDDPAQKIEYISEVDFKEPTRKRENNTDEKELFTGFGSDIITNDNLEPFSDWKYNKIRRGKLLTGGGFAYYKNALFVKDVKLRMDNNNDPINRGIGYKKDDQFLLPDGSKIIVDTVLEPSGQIDSIKSFEPNYDPIDHIINTPSGYSGFTSTDISPQYLGNTGEGALFDYTITVAKLIGYDKAPKEVTPITRISKSSNNGENYVDGEYTTTVEMENTTSKNFDIFYFFHNDPTAYSLGTLFNNNNAHYMISEVNTA